MFYLSISRLDQRVQQIYISSTDRRQEQYILSIYLSLGWIREYRRYISSTDRRQEQFILSIYLSIYLQVGLESRGDISPLQTVDRSIIFYLSISRLDQRVCEIYLLYRPQIGAVYSIYLSISRLDQRVQEIYLLYRLQIGAVYSINQDQED